MKREDEEFSGYMTIQVDDSLQTPTCSSSSYGVPHCDYTEQGSPHLITRNIFTFTDRRVEVNTVLHIIRSLFQPELGKAETNALTITVVNYFMVMLAIYLRERWDGIATLGHPVSLAGEAKETTWFYNICRFSSFIFHSEPILPSSSFSGRRLRFTETAG